MKKFLAVLLVLIMVLSICGCTTDSGKKETISVGYARLDITPTMSVPLAGYGNSSQRMSKSVDSKLYATCLALSDGNGQPVLLYALDLQQPYDEVMAFRRSISSETGVPQNRIMITASHTHSGPDIANDTSTPIAQYTVQLGKSMIQVAKDAIADMKPATLRIGSTDTENMNFVKHYSYVDSNGKTQYFGDNFGTRVVNSTTKHTTEVDTTMHLVEFVREGGKNIVLSNWRAHPHFISFVNSNTKYAISSDYIGTFRDTIESTYNCNFIYFQGAAGNVNATSKIPDEARTTDCGTFGRLLSEYAVNCLNGSMKEVDAGPIQITQTKLACDVDHSTDNLLLTAQTVQKIWKETNSSSQAIAADPTGTIRSPYHANGIISRAYAGASISLELNAISIGNSIALVTAPNELFDTNSAWLETQSPYEMTLTLGYANGHGGYIPSALGYEYTCYESDVSKFVAGTGEKIQETFLAMLNTLAGK